MLRKIGSYFRGHHGHVQLSFEMGTVQRSAKVGAPGSVNFITAVSYQLSLLPSLPAAFTQPGASTLADLCSTEVDPKQVPKPVGGIICIIA